MPRNPRFYAPGVPVHLIQRGNNRAACFFAEEDYRTNVGVPPGNERFKEQIETTLQCKVVHLRRGRPRKVGALPTINEERDEAG